MLQCPQVKSRCLVYLPSKLRLKKSSLETKITPSIHSFMFIHEFVRDLKQQKSLIFVFACRSNSRPLTATPAHRSSSQQMCWFDKKRVEWVSEFNTSAQILRDILNLNLIPFSNIGLFIKHQDLKKKKKRKPDAFCLLGNQMVQKFVCFFN